MKFVWIPSLNRYRRTEGAAKKEKLAYEVLEIETDKDSLIDRFNAYEERIEQLQAELNSSDGTLAATVPLPEVEAPPPSAAPRTDEADMKRKLALSLRGMETDAIEEKIQEAKGAPLARFVEATVSRLGELGEEGFDFLEENQTLTGVGSSFSRGVHILSVVAAGQHQLARVLNGRRKAWGRK